MLQFRILLANGQMWSLLAYGPVESLLRDLARTMYLEPADHAGNGSLVKCTRNPAEENLIHGAPSPSQGAERTLIMVPLNRAFHDDSLTTVNPELVSQLGLPRTGWRMLNLGAVRFRTHAGVPHVVCEVVAVDASTLDALLGTGIMVVPIYEHAVNGGGLPLHAGLVELHGRAYLLAGPAEAGKTTCCTSIPPPWRCLCDDEALLVRDIHGLWVAHPFPTWSHFRNGRSDMTWDVQAHLPVAGVFFLKQSKQDLARPMGQAEATMGIFGSAAEVLRRVGQGHDPQETRQRRLKLFDNACRVAAEIPAFELSVTLGGPFWGEMERLRTAVPNPAQGSGAHGHRQAEKNPGVSYQPRSVPEESACT